MNSGNFRKRLKLDCRSSCRISSGPKNHCSDARHEPHPFLPPLCSPSPLFCSQRWHFWRRVSDVSPPQRRSLPSQVPRHQTTELVPDRPDPRRGLADCWARNRRIGARARPHPHTPQRSVDSSCVVPAIDRMEAVPNKGDCDRLAGRCVITERRKCNAFAGYSLPNVGQGIRKVEQNLMSRLVSS